MLLVAPNGAEVDAREDAVTALLENGFKRPQAAVPVREDEQPTPDFDAMTKAQLLEFSKTHGVEVPSRVTKAQIIAAIRG